MNQMTQRSLSRLLAATVLAGSLTLSAALADEVEQAERVEVGQEAPGFSLQGSDSETYTLSDLEGEKNLILIFFRGSW